MKEGEHDLRDKLKKELNPDGKHGAQVQHKWLWAISPSDNNKVIFVGHCRACNLAFTQKLVVQEYGFTTEQVSLPEWGCRVPMGFV